MQDLFCRYKFIFASAAQGAYPIFGKIFKSGARGDAIVGISDFRIVHITAHVTNVFFHNIRILRVYKM